MKGHRRWIFLVVASLVACQPHERATPPPPARATSASKPPARPPDASLAADLERRFAPPQGFVRVPIGDDVFGAFLRRLPLRPAGTPVRSHEGRVLRHADHPGVAAVAKVELGPRDLQQCADSIIRLHAEWLMLQGRPEAIRYHATSGQVMAWSRWAQGERARLEGNRLSFSVAAPPDASEHAFSRYLDFVFSYAGTVSLAAYAEPVRREDIAPGDFFVLPGGPGHAVLVLDLARDARGRSIALLGQGFMPAQDFHVLKTVAGDTPWFDLQVRAIQTPFWPQPFPWSSLRRMPAR